ncbi:MAG TPA: glycosyltransferase [Candidatus Angelobacter sp.]|jgi:rhamnosyl/mannosyltransferase|nr:glycosyltransferase [Candidatus Angelobacter sp.]
MIVNIETAQPAAQKNHAGDLHRNGSSGTERLKVLQVGKFYDPYRGGMETVLKNLCEGIHGAVDLHLLVANTSPHTVHEQMQFPITRVASWGKLFSSSLTPSFAAWLRKLPGDVVHLHMPNPVAEVSYLLAGGRRPLVAHFHSDIVRQKSLLRAYAPLLESFYTRASRIIVPTPNHIGVSPFVSRLRNKCRVVPFGIPVEKFDLTETTARRAAELRDGRPAILFIGRLVYYKGLEYLLQAMPDLPAQLWIIGTGPLEASLKHLTSQLDLEDKVQFLGDVPEDDLPAYYHACDIFALPSVANSEMFGMVQLEAAACRKPVVSTNLPTGVSWVNQDGVTGLLVPPKDVGALVTAIRKLLGSRSLREELGEAGRQRVEAEFTIAKMTQGILEIYQDVRKEY